MASATEPGLLSSFRTGLALGTCWGLVQSAVAAFAQSVPPALALAECAADALIWGMAGGLLALPARLAPGPARRRAHAVLLLGAFFTTYVFHAALAAGLVPSSRWRDLAPPVGGAALVLLGALFLVSRRGLRAPDRVPLALWVLASILAATLFYLGERLAPWQQNGLRQWVLVAAGVVAACALAGLFLAGWPLRRRAAALLVLVGLCVGAWPQGRSSAYSGPVAAGDPQTPVILISLDTTRPDHLSLYGYERPTTPRLEELGRSARVYTRAYSTSSWTLPSHASAFTGLLPSEHGAHYPRNSKPGDLPMRMSSAPVTLAEEFASLGYRTAAIAANPISVSPVFGLDQGFQDLDACWRPPRGTLPLTFLHTLWKHHRTPFLERVLACYWPADSITDRALRWVRAAGSTPFLLFLNYMDAHRPWQSRPLLPAAGGKEPEDPPGDHDLYDAAIRFMDGELGRLFDGLRELGLYEKALIVVFSDHGEFLGEYGMTGHGQSLDEPVLRAVLAVREAGGRNSGTEKRLTTLADIPAIVRAALGTAAPEELLGADAPRIAAEICLPETSRRNERWGDVQEMTAVLWGDLKLIAFPGGARLYDVARDPLEARDLARERPEETRQMLAFFERWQEESTRAAGSAPGPASAEILRALGYVE